MSLQARYKITVPNTLKGAYEAILKSPNDRNSERILIKEQDTMKLKRQSTLKKLKMTIANLKVYVICLEDIEKEIALCIMDDEKVIHPDNV